MLSGTNAISPKQTLRYIFVLSCFSEQNWPVNIVSNEALPFPAQSLSIRNCNFWQWNNFLRDYKQSGLYVRWSILHYEKENNSKENDLFNDKMNVGM